MIPWNKPKNIEGPTIAIRPRAPSIPIPISLDIIRKIKNQFVAQILLKNTLIK